MFILYLLQYNGSKAFTIFSLLVVLFAWQTSEILCPTFIQPDAMRIVVFLFQTKYRAKGIEAFKEYSVVTDTPVYETAKQNAQNLSDVWKPFVLFLHLTH